MNKKTINPYEILSESQIYEYKQAFEMFLHHEAAEHALQQKKKGAAEQVKKKTVVANDNEEQSTEEAPCIRLEKLKWIMQSLFQDPSETELREMVQEADKDGSGSIDFDEFLMLMVNKDSQLDNMDEMREAFKIFDRNGTGYITVESIKEVFHHIGQMVTDEECKAMIIENDTTGSFCNGKGELRMEFNDFLHLMRQPSNELFQEDHSALRTKITQKMRRRRRWEEQNFQKEDESIN